MVNKKIKKRKKPLEKILIFVIIALIICLAVFIIFYLSNKQKFEEEILGNFSFEGFNYSIIKVENITFYNTNFSIPSKNITYKLYLRYDPRENNVSINISLKEIKATTYIAIDKNFDNKSCNELLLALYRLTEFLHVLGVNKEVL